MFVSRNLFDELYGDGAQDQIERFSRGDFGAIEDCPLVLNSVDDIGGHVERSLLKRAGIAHPRVVATSNNVETLLALCVRSVGACFCPEILAQSALTEEQYASLLLLRLGPSAQYQIRFGYQEHSYQWSIVDAFMQVAKQTMSQ